MPNLTFGNFDLSESCNLLIWLDSWLDAPLLAFRFQRTSIGKTKEVTARTNMCTIQEGSLRSLKQLRQLSVFLMGRETKQQIWGSCNAFILKCLQQNMKALFFSKEKENSLAFCRHPYSWWFDLSSGVENQVKLDWIDIEGDTFHFCFLRTPPPCIQSDKIRQTQVKSICFQISAGVARLCLDQNGHVGTSDWQVPSQYFQLPTPTHSPHLWKKTGQTKKIPTISAILAASCFHINIGSSGKRQAANANDKRVCGGGGYSLELIHHRWLFYHHNQHIQYNSHDKAMPGFLSDIRVAERLLARCETNRETVSSLPFEFPTCQRCHFCPLVTPPHFQRATLLHLNP